MSRLDDVCDRLIANHPTQTKNSKELSETEKVCNICQGTYWIRTESGSVRRCPCYERERQARRMRFATIPDKYKDVSLQATRIDLYKTKQNQDAMKKIIDVINIYIEEQEEHHANGKGLYLWSDMRGSGKTRIAACIANELIKKYQVKFASSISILEEIKATWSKDRDYSESTLIDNLIMSDILIIDDFGVEKPKDWVNDKFYHIINERYINKRVTIYTSNVDVTNLPYDSRIANRVVESTYRIHFPEESVRNMIGAYNQMQLRKMGGC